MENEPIRRGPNFLLAQEIIEAIENAEIQSHGVPLTNEQVVLVVQEAIDAYQERQRVQGQQSTEG
jgi:hypothetical protein